MSTFFDKLAGKLNAAADVSAVPPTGVPGAPAPIVPAVPGVPAPAADPQKKAAAAATPPQDEESDEGEPLDVDLFQSDGRMIVFAALGGATPGDFDITLDEDSNTAIIKVVQNRPDPPLLKGVQPEKGTLEKGRFLKQEVKWRTLYRKVYLPAPFDAGRSEALLKSGALLLLLPNKVVGEGRKVSVKEVLAPEKP